ncbi:hypothetical protein CYMTET_22979 [Cymbomonas tetramitiformis]|uniref:Uncharacterized protein n=1 Tax=Cymbomonas tetramitiformis TaxID=36881 RepID=A0AAE0FZA6_9CHLO|nr:hypothetical protein CYMTET_22979 [Cymbomonas tetramitiformis]
MYRMKSIMSSGHCAYLKLLVVCSALPDVRGYILGDYDYRECWDDNVYRNFACQDNFNAFWSESPPSSVQAGAELNVSTRLTYPLTWAIDFFENGNGFAFNHVNLHACHSGRYCVPQIGPDMNTVFHSQALRFNATTFDYQNGFASAEQALFFTLDPGLWTVFVHARVLEVVKGQTVQHDVAYAFELSVLEVCDGYLSEDNQTCITCRNGQIGDDITRTCGC